MDVAIGSKSRQATTPGLRVAAIALGAAVAIATSAALGALAVHDQNGGADRLAAFQRAKLQAIAAQPAMTPPDLVFYIVGSDADREIIEAQLDQAAWIAVEGNFIPPKTRNVVLVAPSEAGDSEVSRMIGEMSSADASTGKLIEVNDMRRPETMRSR